MVSLDFPRPCGPFELYDSAAGWRGGKKLHFHPPGAPSHSFLFGPPLGLGGLSLLLTFLNEWLGRVVASVSLLATASVTEIERNLFLYHQKIKDDVQEIKAGMPCEEVEAALGPPLSRVQLAEKVLYKYKDMTVTFQEGKVIDVC